MSDDVAPPVAPSVAAAPRLAARAEEALALVEGLGVDSARVSVRRRRAVTALHGGTEASDLRHSTVRTVEVVLRSGGRALTVSTTDLRPEALQRQLAAAVDLLRQGVPELLAVHGAVPKGPVPVGPFDGLRLVDPDLVPPRSRLGAEHAAVVAEATKARVSLTLSSEAEAVARTDGARVAWSHTHADLRLRRGGVALRRRTRRLADLPPAAALADALSEHHDLQAAPPVPPPSAAERLVVHPEAGGPLVRSLVAAPLRTRRVSERLSVFSDPWLAGGLGSRPFDADGRPTRPVPLVEGGLQRRRWSHDPTLPGDRRLALGGRPLGRLVGETDHGVLVRGWSRVEVAPGTTRLHAVGYGWRLERGARAEPLSRLVVSVDLGELFRHLVTVGSDPWAYGPVHTPALVFGGVPLRAG